jgi:hypothetical protein
MKAVQRQEMNPQAFESEKAAYKQNLLQRMQNQYYSAWFKSLTDKANIKDYRDQYF